MRARHPLKERFDMYIRRAGIPYWNLAHRLGIDRTYLSHLVNGRKPWNKENLTHACNILEITDEREKRDLFVLAKLTEPSISPPSSKIDAQPATPQAPLQKPIPFQIPKARAGQFVGRIEEIDILLQKLYPGHGVTLFGPAGMGKTEIAIKAAERLSSDNELAKRFSDGIVYHDFYIQNQRAPESALIQIVHSFEEKLEPTPDAAAMRVLANRRVLLILDGTEWADDLQRVLDVVGKDCGVLITTQRQADSRGVQIDINPLPLTEVQEILRTYGGKYADNEKAIEQLYTLVGGTTLFMDLIGHDLKEQKQEIKKFVEWLEEKPFEALNFSDADKPPHRRDNGQRLIELLISHVSQKAQLILAVMGVLAYQPVTLTTLMAALEVRENDLWKPLRELQNYHLLLHTKDHNEEELYQVHHRLLYAYIKDYQPAPDQVRTQLAAYYTTLAQEHLKQGPTGYKRLEPERAHMVTVVSGCVASKQWEEVQHLALTIQHYLDIQGHWLDEQTILHAGLTAAKALQDRQKESNFLYTLGNLYILQGKLDQALACLQQALAMEEQLGDVKGIADTYNSLGCNYASQGKEDQALACFQQSLQLKAQLGVDKGVADTYNNLGKIYHLKGDWDQAIEYYVKGIDIAWQRRDFDVGSYLFNNLGASFYGKGELDAALESFQQALYMMESSWDINGLAFTYNNLGLVYADKAEWDQAIDYSQKALALFSKVGDHQGESKCLNNLAKVYIHMGRYNEIIEVYQKAIKLDPNDPSNYHNLANLYQALGQLDEAAQWYSRQIELQPMDALSAHVQLGLITLKQGHEALKHFENALAVWDAAWETRPLSDYQLLKYKAIALIGVGDWQQGIAVLKDASSQRLLRESIDLSINDALAAASNPPQGLAEMHRFLIQHFLEAPLEQDKNE